MLTTFIRLLAEDARFLRRYALLAIAYGLLCGLTIASLVPLLSYLLQGAVTPALPWLAILLVGLVLSWLLRHYVEHAGIKVGVLILQGTRQRLGQHVASLPVGWFTPENTAQLSHMITQGVMSIAQLPAHVFTPVITGIVTPAVLAITLCILHWPTGLLALLALPLLAGTLLLSAKLNKRAGERLQQHFAATSQGVVEFAQAQSVLRAFNGAGTSTHRLHTRFAQQRQSGLKLIGRAASSAVLNTWTVQLIFAGLLISIALWLNDIGSASLARADIIAAVLSLLLVSRFIDALLEVIGYSEILHSARGQLMAIAQLFAVKPLPAPTNPKIPQAAAVQLQDLSFRFTPKGPDVLSGINCYIAPGSMTAIVGKSGSGKTTLLQLIARFHDVCQGSILLDGTDVRSITEAELANQFSQIFQQSYLFTGTIAENIRLGKPDANEAEVLAAAALAGVTEIITRLPQGLATQVGEAGALLSGGERQRIAIARALLKDAPIYLIDEATAALDTENQAAISRVLNNLRGKRTIIVIAHQLSTVAMADHVLVLDDGRLVEQGTPAQLRSSKGLYAEFLAARQSAKGWRIGNAATAKEIV